MKPLLPCDQPCRIRFSIVADRLSAGFSSAARGIAKVSQMTALAAVVVSGGVLAGCTIPSDCGDLDYPTYGGAWQRTRRDSGRVGSVFDPAGARTATLSPRELPDTDGQTRSARDSILSTPPDSLRGPADGTKAEDDPLRQPSPSDKNNADKLRDLQLDDINIQRGSPVPRDLN
ncbi:MAG TPA: hypothetical protein DDZ51_28020 [Planctomycetaceae bacterium]|nr:hypothetical protein [Planctomycetaceae bacterium]